MTSAPELNNGTNPHEPKYSTLSLSLSKTSAGKGTLLCAEMSKFKMYL